eukprot:16254253-Heterocapsa_arctica.AAC.1
MYEFFNRSDVKKDGLRMCSPDYASVFKLLRPGSPDDAPAKSGFSTPRRRPWIVEAMPRPQSNRQ